MNRITLRDCKSALGEVCAVRRKTRASNEERGGGRCPPPTAGFQQFACGGFIAAIDRTRRKTAQNKAKRIGIAPHGLIAVREFGWSLLINGCSSARFARSLTRPNGVAVLPHRCVLEASRLERDAPNILEVIAAASDLRSGAKRRSKSASKGYRPASLLSGFCLHQPTRLWRAGRLARAIRRSSAAQHAQEGARLRVESAALLLLRKIATIKTVVIPCAPRREVPLRRHGTLTCSWNEGWRLMATRKGPVSAVRYSAALRTAPRTG